MLKENLFLRIVKLSYFQLWLNEEGCSELRKKSLIFNKF